MAKRTKQTATKTPAPSATLKIDIWSRDDTELPADLSEAFAPHVEYVARACEQGYLAGEIIDERFRGWWTIDHNYNPA